MALNVIQSPERRYLIFDREHRAVHTAVDSRDVVGRSRVHILCKALTEIESEYPEDIQLQFRSVGS